MTKTEEEKRPMPTFIWDLDKYFFDLKTQNVMDFYEHQVDSKFPSFSDLNYRNRRKQITQLAFNYKHGERIPRVEYTSEELDVWKRVYSELSGQFKLHSCKEHLAGFEMLERENIYSPDWIPQLEDVSRFLQKKIGFQLRPVGGQIGIRDFFEILSFRMIPCTQYLRHPLAAHHNPEPDIIHELLGHLPLMLSPGFADFFHEVGLLSIGISDEDLDRLFTFVWWTIEWGLCREGDEIKTWGAAILSSYGEINNVFSGCVEVRELNKNLAKTIQPFTFKDPQFQDQDYQKVVYLADSLIDGQNLLTDFVKRLKRTARYRFDPLTQSVERLDDPTTREKLKKEVIKNVDLLAC